VAAEANRVKAEFEANNKKPRKPRTNGNGK
jgi:hypothetical protein